MSEKRQNFEKKIQVFKKKEFLIQKLQLKNQLITDERSDKNKLQRMNSNQ